MNEPTSTPTPPTPNTPQSSMTDLWNKTEPLEEQNTTPAKLFESLLREPFRVLKAVDGNQSIAKRVTLWLTITFFLCTAIFGLVVGTFGMGDQLWAAPAKLVAGIAISLVICLPSLYIFSCLGGSKISLTTTAVLISAASALIGILLIGFAPVFWIFAQSTDSVATIGVLFLGIWVVCLVFATRLVRNTIASFAKQDSRQVSLWILIFTLVTFQMSCTLRPILGTSDEFLAKDKKFFLVHWMENLTPDLD